MKAIGVIKKDTMDYSGMTVNERLFVSGLLDEFDKARKQKDIAKVIDILKSLEVDQNSIEKILKKMAIP